MLYHALSFLADKGISHNDLHLNNIRIRSVQPVIARFGDKQFFITCIPQIIDWDLGRAVTCPNRALDSYNPVGILTVATNSVISLG